MRTAKTLIRLGGDAQADLSLRRAHIPFCWFCLAVAHKTLLPLSLDRTISILRNHQISILWPLFFPEQDGGCKVRSKKELSLLQV